MLSRHAQRLQRVVQFRLDPRLSRRIDAADVVQEIFLEACAHQRDFESQSELPLFLWLRGIATNKLLEVHRRHLGTQMRDARREVTFCRRTPADHSSGALVDLLAGHGTRASEAAVRLEVKAQLQDALNQLDPLDREVLVLKHFEQLTSREAGQVLEIQERAAAKRYLRALARLKETLAAMPGGLGGLLA
jgi:RNA polymerase sigma-70 factor (ECF subfamily)